MTHLSTHVTGDIISAQHLNDIKLMIDDGAYDIDTYALNVGSKLIINNSGHILPVRLQSRDSGGLSIYASDGLTQIALIDEDGNLFIKGSIGSL